MSRSICRNITFGLEYARDGEGLDVRAGFARKLRYDSYVGLVGQRVRGTRIGAARENRFHAEVATERGRLRLALDPYTGWVDADDAGDNAFIGLGGRLEYELRESSGWKLSGVLATDIHRYHDDAFGIDPADPSRDPGGYFSPQLFVEALPGISTSIEWGESAFLDFEGGPAVQLVDESGGGAEFSVGGRARLSYLYFLEDSMFWSFRAGFIQISDAYTRVDWGTSLTFKF